LLQLILHFASQLLSAEIFLIQLEVPFRFFLENRAGREQWFEKSGLLKREGKRNKAEYCLFECKEKNAAAFLFHISV
jgi:hypothetical protein